MLKVKHILNQGFHALLFNVCIFATVIIGIRIAKQVGAVTMVHMSPWPAALTATACCIGFIAVVAAKGLMPYSQWLEKLLRS
jgi:hypothetical protein